MNISDAINTIESVAGVTDESTPAGEAWAAILRHIRSTPVAQPVPVSERLPGPGDCTSQGWCWVLYRGYSTWTLESPFGQDGQPTGCSHWLPAHALPLPGEVEG